MRNHTTHFDGDCGCLEQRVAALEKRMDEVLGGAPRVWHDATGDGPHDYGDCGGNPVDGCREARRQEENAVHVSVNTPDPANGPQGWKAREGQGYEHGKGFEKVFWYEAVERHPKAREWWLCVACGRTFGERPTFHWWTLDEVCHAQHGWLRVLEIERTP